MTADPILLILSVTMAGFLIAAIVIIGHQGKSLEAAHARLVEYANTIRELKERLSQPRAPKGWTHG